MKRLSELIEQHFGVLELYTWFATKTHFDIENPILLPDVLSGVFFENMFSQEVWPRNLEK